MSKKTVDGDSKGKTESNVDSKGKKKSDVDGKGKRKIDVDGKGKTESDVDSQAMTTPKPKLLLDFRRLEMLHLLLIPIPIVVNALPTTYVIFHLITSTSAQQG